jgi:hypothetical protein
MAKTSKRFTAEENAIILNCPQKKLAGDYVTASRTQSKRTDLP